MRGLYPIVDVDVLQRAGSDPVEFLGAVLMARPPLVQLRAKQLGARETLELLRAFRVLTRSAGTELFANDRPDLAVLAECDGVHVGQSDLPAEDVRQCFPSLKLGVSTHTLDQLEQALAVRPDYVAFGPVFQTGSKRNAEAVVGLEGLRNSAARVRGQCPLVAIGGIDVANAADVGGAADLAAVIAALVPASPSASAVTSAALELTRVFTGRSV